MANITIVPAEVVETSASPLIFLLPANWHSATPACGRWRVQRSSKSTPHCWRPGYWGQCRVWSDHLG